MRNFYNWLFLRYARIRSFWLVRVPTVTYHSVAALLFGLVLGAGGVIQDCCQVIYTIIGRYCPKIG